MKINVTYGAGPGRDTNTGVDFMIADISALGLPQDELYAEVDPYSFIPQMGGTDKICEIYPEYTEIIQDIDPCDTADLEKLVSAIECQDQDFNAEDFWSSMMEAFLWEADAFTGPYLEAEIISQAKALGISEEDLDFCP